MDGLTDIRCSFSSSFLLPSHSALAEFPERPGALRKFLQGMRSGWNISLFHYRNHGAGAWLFIVEIHKRMSVLTLEGSADVGKVLAGVQVPPGEDDAFGTFLERLGYAYVEESNNFVYKRYLRR